MKDFFKPEDFPEVRANDYLPNPCGLSEYCAAAANAKLNAEIEKWPVSECVMESDGFLRPVRRRDEQPTHIVRIAFLEELEPKECKHEPDLVASTNTLVISGWYRCRHCGIKLRAKWEVAE